jgi:Sec-independent protein translocase protein TatA
MARKCSTPGCEFPLPDKYPLDKCPWHMAPGQGPVKIAAALAIAAAGLGGGFAYKKFRTYLSEKKLRKEREQKARSVARKRSVKSQKRTRTRKTAKSKRKQAGSKTSQDLS